MRYVVTAEEMRALDAATIEGLGLPGAILMENAGRRVADVLLGEWIRGGEHVAVVCGAGNNGGDGYVIARRLRDEGVDAVVYLAAAEDKLAGDARLHHEVYRNMGGPVVSIAGAAGLAEHAHAIERADIAVDAVFGTGLARAVSGHYRAVIETINRCRGRRLAVDIPSGLSADTGEALGVAVDAHCTVTMAFLKVGLAVSPGFGRAGDVRVAEIGIPVRLAGERGVRAWLVEAADMAPLVPRPSLTEHKNRRGHVLAVAGSPGKRGAARLVSWAALRCGAGLVTMASPWTQGEAQAPDPVMTAPLDPDAERDPVAALAALAEGKQALAMGPGMPTSQAGRAMVRGALEGLEVPLVLDADALNHLGTDLGLVAAARAPVILTPHPGEAARLLGCSASDVQKDRLGAARGLAERSRAVVVLKGARTVICDGTGERDEGQSCEVSINPTGGAALATAGSGDVLTGVIAALVAQGLAAIDAARLGTYVHGRAGQLAAGVLGERGVTSADLADHLPRALAELSAPA
jgi:ADP-dependent NAD(P)H-hydrate dehydratase / NAD(P)H-hydrate epimerase